MKIVVSGISLFSENVMVMYDPNVYAYVLPKLVLMLFFFRH